jgi:two-component system, NarL family, nitrate/nitrite response regulator NarL
LLKSRTANRASAGKTQNSSPRISALPGFGTRFWRCAAASKFNPENRRERTSWRGFQLMDRDRQVKQKITVGIVDDHPLMREGVAQSLRNASSVIEIVATGGTAEEAIAIAKNHGPDILLLDVSIPGGGIEAAYAIAANGFNGKIVMLTVSERPSHVTAALEAGARGYLLKGASGKELVRAILAVHGGQVYVSPELAGLLLSGPLEHLKENIQIRDRPIFTERENNIAEFLAQGKTNKEIAEILNLREKTIKHYMTNIFQKLGVRNRVEAVLLIKKNIHRN